MTNLSQLLTILYHRKNVKIWSLKIEKSLRTGGLVITLRYVQFILIIDKWNGIVVQIKIRA